MKPQTATSPALCEVQSSLSGRLWQARPVDTRLAEAISQRFDLPEVAGRVLAGRGVGLEEVAAFLNPSLREFLPDPSSLRDMDRAAERIAAAIISGEATAVFGDYDVDGATSSALLKRFFDAAGGNLVFYIPDRMKEGYGPNAPALKKLADDGISLVITVDCGILSFEPLATAARIGLDVIVVDHHKADPALPDAHAVINPNRLDESGDLGHLAAVGVAYLLVIAVNRVLREAGWYRNGRIEPNLLAWLDIVALGTVCDVVPLTGLNRAFVAQGLKVMAGRENTGLAALSDVGGIQETPNAYHAGFILGPRVNAGGRIGESDLGARLLTTADKLEAKAIAERLNALNLERREIENTVLGEAVTAVESRKGLTGEAGPVIFAAGQGWHPGVIGIVASRLKDRYQRPALVIGIENGIAKGSARSIRGVDIGAAVIEASRRGLLMNGGGHAMAAGLTANEDKLPELETFLAEWLADDVKKAQRGASLQLDGLLALKGANPDLLSKLQMIAPYGVGNPEPRFAIPNVSLIKVDIVGKDHVRCIFAGSDGGRIKAMAFRSAGQPLGEALLTGAGRRFHIAGKLKLDDWGNIPKAEMFLDDAAYAE